MNCPHCGGNSPVVQARCTGCGRLVSARPDVATAVLTPPPPPAPADMPTIDSELMFTGLGQTRMPAGSDIDITSFNAPPLRDIDITGFNTPPTGAADVTGFGTPVPPTDDMTQLPDASRPSASAGPLAIGQRFGPRYRIVKLLGIGGMGAVYQAWDSELDVVVALKVIRPEASSDPHEVAAIERRFKQELLLARQVTHKNVVRIHDLGEIDGIKYITMSFHPGRRSRNRAAARRQAAGARGAADHAPAGVGPARRARGRRRASRPEARQHHDRRRPRHHHGLRHRAIVWRRAAAGDRRPTLAPAVRTNRNTVPDPGGQHRRHHRLHGARAGQGRAGRSARRHVFARADRVRHADRPAPAQQRPQRDRGAAAPHHAAAAGPADRSTRTFRKRSIGS